MQTQTNSIRQKNRPLRRNRIFATTIPATVACLILLEATRVASAALWVQQARITGSWPLGFAVDLSSDGTKAIVGDDSGTAVPLQKSSSGTWLTEVHPGFYSSSDVGYSSCDFGHSVAISESGYAVIGSPIYFRQYGDYGAAHFWTEKGWRWDDSDSYWVCCSTLGHAVAMSDDLAVVGSPGYADKGLVEIYQPDTDGQWRRTAAMFPSDLGEGDSFGWSVAITKVDGSYYLAVGTPGQEAVYVYRKQVADWLLDQKITASENRFGAYVSISGDRLAVGSADTAYILKRSNGAWFTEAAFALDANGDSTQSSASVLSGAVAVDGDYAVFGAASEAKAFVFARGFNGWTKRATLRSLPGSFFGWALDMSHSQIIVGAPNERAAYIYKWQ